MGKLEELIPKEQKRNAAFCGSELVFEYSDALAVIRIARENHVAVLGLEAFEGQPDGLLTVGYSGYDAAIKLAGDWNAYADAMNIEAEKWLTANKLNKTCGYIVTSATECELMEAKRLITSKKGLISKLLRIR